MKKEDMDKIVAASEWKGYWESLINENTALHTRVAKLEKTLAPFAHEAYGYDPDEDDDNQTAFDTSIKIGQLRAARRALEEK